MTTGIVRIGAALQRAKLLALERIKYAPIGPADAAVSAEY